MTLVVRRGAATGIDTVLRAMHPRDGATVDWDRVGRLLCAGDAGGDWRRDARCRDLPLSLFFPPERSPSDRGDARVEAAKTLCRQCAVRFPCLRSALERDEQWGVWGGLDASERMALRRRIAANGDGRR